MFTVRAMRIAAITASDPVLQNVARSLPDPVTIYASSIPDTTVPPLSVKEPPVSPSMKMISSEVDAGRRRSK